MQFKLRDYQEELIDKINDSQSKRNCIQLATGGGKTIIFSHIINNFKGRVLVLVNRKELVYQTEKNITKDCFLIVAGVRKIELKEVNIGMVETVYNRVKRKSININDFDLIIADEVHNLQFVKLFDNYTNRLLGFTATPVINKTETYKKDGIKFIQKHSLSKWYGDLICGVKISHLISEKYLTPVVNLSIPNDNLSKLEEDSSGNYTDKSQDEAFNNSTTIECLYDNYIEHCIGQKTMIFNTNIESNNNAYLYFVDQGLSCRSYDSKSDENRTEIVEWFRQTKDAILFSVGVFTTGFDVDDVECIIMNKATKSLSLYHQIVGRGGRITDKIFKPYFKFIDLGGNLERFGSWDNDVNWLSNYKGSIRQVLESYYICDSCFEFVKQKPCEECGYIKERSDVRITYDLEHKGIAVAQTKLPKPTAEMMLNFAIRTGADINDVKNKTADYILRMFQHSKTSEETYRKHKFTMKLAVLEIIRPIYFALHKSTIKGNRYRTIDDFENKVYKRLNKYYYGK